MDNTPSLAITDVTIRQSPLLDSRGQVQTTTTATFTVGPHGPFTLSWPGATPTAADIAAAIKAKVDELRALGVAIAQLNARP